MKNDNKIIEFSQRHTNICKGIAIIMMYIHHLFTSADTQGMEQVIFVYMSQETWIEFAQLCKMCVAIFVFLTSYGISVQIERGKNGVGCCLKRYKNLLWGFLVVYVNSQIFSFFSVRTRVSVYGTNILGRFFYTLLDAAGLARAFKTPTYNTTWWYMTFAVILIFLVPMLYEITKRWGIGVVILSALVPRMAEMDMGTYFWWYIFSIILGIFCATDNIFEKILLLSKTVAHSLFYYAGGLICIGFIIVLSIIRSNYGYMSVVDGLVAFCVCYFVYAYLSRVGFISSILQILGKHSGNMFLTHTFIKAYFLNEWTYSFRYPILILLILLLDTLILSICIEEEKKLLKLFCCKMKNKVRYF